MYGLGGSEARVGGGERPTPVQDEGAGDAAAGVSVGASEPRRWGCVWGVGANPVGSREGSWMHSLA